MLHQHPEAAQEPALHPRSGESTIQTTGQETSSSLLAADPALVPPHLLDFFTRLEEREKLRPFLPLMGSVDVRQAESGRVCAVDVNRYPQGFNNVYEKDFEIGAKLLRQRIEEDRNAGDCEEIKAGSSTTGANYSNDFLVGHRVVGKKKNFDPEKRNNSGPSRWPVTGKQKRKMVHLHIVEEDYQKRPELQKKKMVHVHIVEEDYLKAGVGPSEQVQDNCGESCSSSSEAPARRAQLEQGNDKHAGVMKVDEQEDAPVQLLPSGGLAQEQHPYYAHLKALKQFVNRAVGGVEGEDSVCEPQDLVVPAQASSSSLHPLVGRENHVFNILNTSYPSDLAAVEEVEDGRPRADESVETPLGQRQKNIKAIAPDEHDPELYNSYCKHEVYTYIHAWLEELRLFEKNRFFADAFSRRIASQAESSSTTETEDVEQPGEQREVDEVAMLNGAAQEPQGSVCEGKAPGSRAYLGAPGDPAHQPTNHPRPAPLLLHETTDLEARFELLPANAQYCSDQLAFFVGEKLVTMASNKGGTARAPSSTQTPWKKVFIKDDNGCNGIGLCVFGPEDLVEVGRADGRGGVAAPDVGGGPADSSTSKTSTGSTSRGCTDESKGRRVVEPAVPSSSLCTFGNNFYGSYVLQHRVKMTNQHRKILRPRNKVCLAPKYVLQEGIPTSLGRREGGAVEGGDVVPSASSTTSTNLAQNNYSTSTTSLSTSPVCRSTSTLVSQLEIVLMCVNGEIFSYFGRELPVVTRPAPAVADVEKQAIADASTTATSTTISGAVNNRSAAVVKKTTTSKSSGGTAPGNKNSSKTICSTDGANEEDHHDEDDDHDTCVSLNVNNVQFVQRDRFEADKEYRDAFLQVRSQWWKYVVIGKLSMLALAKQKKRHYDGERLQQRRNSEGVVSKVKPLIHLIPGTKVELREVVAEKVDETVANLSGASRVEQEVVSQIKEPPASSSASSSTAASTTEIPSTSTSVVSSSISPSGMLVFPSSADTAWSRSNDIFTTSTSTPGRCSTSNEGTITLPLGVELPSAKSRTPGGTGTPATSVASTPVGSAVATSRGGVPPKESYGSAKTTSSSSARPGKNLFAGNFAVGGSEQLSTTGVQVATAPLRETPEACSRRLSGRVMRALNNKHALTKEHKEVVKKLQKALAKKQSSSSCFSGKQQDGTENTGTFLTSAGILAGPSEDASDVEGAVSELLTNIEKATNLPSVSALLEGFLANLSPANGAR
ncbi:unnamed protein product [Amoebophrya sp. A120]|nr:unnamed protein product [Amoebophrya sp. A120]|eukprot:GSA120T00007048001.1